MLIPALIIILVVIFVFIQSRKPDPEKIFGIYSQPGKWFFLKYYAMLGLLTLRRLKFDFFGKEFFFKVKDLEKLQPLSTDPLALDAVFFQAVSQDGIYLCGGIERRHEAKVNGLFYILVPEYGLLLSEKLPKTLLQADPASVWSLKEYAAEGICFTPVEPMKTWKVSFRGKMKKHNEPEQTVNVELKATWTSELPWFLFETDLPLKMLAKSIAREPWSKELFEALKDAHQTHYEQMGYMDGSLKIDGKEIPLKLDAFRDHSFGHKRDWSLMHRYIFHMFYLSNKTRICLGVVCQPCTASHLEMGYVVHANKKIHPIQECDLLLYRHGENGHPASELAFTFRANDVTYEAKVKYEWTVVHYVGNDRDAKMHERFVTCEINGVKGRGISEWHYNNTGGAKK